MSMYETIRKNRIPDGIDLDHEYETLWVNEDKSRTRVTMSGRNLVALVGTDGVDIVEYDHFSDAIKVCYTDRRVQVFEYYLPWIVSEGVGR